MRGRWDENFMYNPNSVHLLSLLLLLQQMGLTCFDVSINNSFTVLNLLSIFLC